MYNLDLTNKAGKRNSDREGLSGSQHLFSESFKAMCNSFHFGFQPFNDISAIQKITVDAMPSTSKVNNINLSNVM